MYPCPVVRPLHAKAVEIDPARISIVRVRTCTLFLIHACERAFGQRVLFGQILFMHAS